MNAATANPTLILRRGRQRPIGRAMKIGDRYSTRPLIWPTLHKAFAFLVLLVVLTIIEEVIVGLFHHQSAAASLDELFGAKLDESLAGIVILLLVLIPYFAIRVLSEALGEEGKLARMFFVDRGSVPRMIESTDVPTVLTPVESGIGSRTPLV